MRLQITINLKGCVYQHGIIRWCNIEQYCSGCDFYVELVNFQRILYVKSLQLTDPLTNILNLVWVYIVLRLYLAEQSVQRVDECARLIPKG